MKTIHLIICLMFASGLVAQEQVLDLWPNGIPNHKATDEKEVQTYTSSLRIEKVNEPTLAVFLPSKKMATGQAVVVCPGGGYHHLAYSWEGTDIAKWLNAQGIAAFVLKYRMPMAQSVVVSHQAPLQDAQRALRIVRANADKWNVKSDKIGVMGFSAGGHLAATLGTQFATANTFKGDSIDSISARPDFMALIYPVISMDAEITNAGSRKRLLGENPTPELVAQFSNEKQVSENTPPSFLLHSSNDKAVPLKNSLLFFDALLQNKVEAEMHIYPYGKHGYGMAQGNGRLGNWRELFLAWLQAL